MVVKVESRMKAKEERGREREKGVLVGPTKIPWRDTGEVSNGAFYFPLAVKSCGAYHILGRWGRVVAKRGQFLLIPF